MNSSSHSSKPPRPEAKGTQPYIDYGPTLPERYGVPKIHALVRDPRAVFAYWEFPGGAGEFQVRIVDVATGRYESYSAGDLGSRYFDVHPDREYEVVLGRRDGSALLLSNRVRTPREVPATESDESLTDGQRDVWRALGGDREMLPSPKFGYLGPRHG